LFVLFGLCAQWIDRSLPGFRSFYNGETAVRISLVIRALRKNVGSLDFQRPFLLPEGLNRQSLWVYKGLHKMSFSIALFGCCCCYAWAGCRGSQVPCGSESSYTFVIRRSTYARHGPSPAGPLAWDGRHV
jgi:hypothetical protein